MPTISVAMIVKNESHHLASCLDTVKDWVDEIVILDSGSTDDTQRRTIRCKILPEYRLAWLW